MQHLKDASKKEKLAKELETAVLQEELKLKQLTEAQKQLDNQGRFYCCYDSVFCYMVLGRVGH